jgi:hypothetical protein
VIYLQDFAKKEGFDNGEQFCKAMHAAQADNPRTAKMVKLLVAATEYKKFVLMMRRMAKKKAEEEAGF